MSLNTKTWYLFLDFALKTYDPIDCATSNAGTSKAKKSHDFQI